MTNDKTDAQTGKLSALFTRQTTPATLLLGAGIGLEALEFYVTSSLMPSMVRDIGGLELLSWTTSLFIVAIVLGSIAVVVRPPSVNLNQTYIAGALFFALGCIIIGLAPDMRVVLLGRTVQGFGAGLLVTMGYSFIRFVYPPGVQNAASAFYSSLWGVAVFLGPTVGGLFATGSHWRWAFLALIPLALLMALAAPRWLPKGDEERAAAPVPFVQIALILASVLAFSFAGATENNPLRAALLVAGLISAVGLVLFEIRSAQRLLPRGGTRWKLGFARVYLTMSMLIITLNSDIYIPYFLQTLHGVTPLVAGYLVALVALGWTSGSLATASFGEERGKRTALVGTALISLALAGLSFTVSRQSSGDNVVAIASISVLLFLMGLGIGVGWAHLVSMVLTRADPDEADKASASINLVQSIAGAIGAALAGVIANAAGLVTPGGISGAVSASIWLYGLMAVPCMVAFFVFLPMIKNGR